jgi:hypothetical protein
VVADVWTWNIDVQEMQFMYDNLHLPNSAAGAYTRQLLTST